MKAWLTTLVGSVWVWSILPTFIVGLFIEDIADRYTFYTENVWIGESRVLYADLNEDGISEVIYGRPGPPLNNFTVMDQNNRYYEQWNVPNDITSELSPLLVGNYDHDGFAELYLFTSHEDSVFLNVNESLDSQGFRLERFFITTVNLVEGHIDSNMKLIGFFDQDGDGKDELYFRISSGFSLVPRLCYFVDLVHHKLKSSPFTGINFNTAYFADLDSDGRPEVLSNMTASGNYHTPTPFTDYSAWLMVLDDQLQIKFKPTEFPGFGGSLDMYALGAIGQKNLFAVYNYKGIETVPQSPSVIVYTPDGQPVNQRRLAELGINSVAASSIVRVHERENVLLSAANKLFLMNLQLDIFDQSELSYTPDMIQTVDVNGDRSDEILVFHNAFKDLSIYDASLRHLGTLPLNYSPSLIELQPLTTASGEKKLFIRSAGRGDAYILRASENPNFWMGYLVYPAIYFGTGLFLMLLKRETTRQVERREQQRRKIQALQLQSIKAQLDPHFTFNALNSVASLLYLDDRNTAYDYLNKFTRLLRQLLSDAERVYRSLDEEIEFVTAYLNLEKLRFGDKFDYSITMGDGITGKENVPVMVLQTFAENAVKHGLMPLPSGGRLTIHIQKDEDYLKLTIEDNGIGRKKAAENNKRQGKGLKMIEEFYGILNQMNPKPIQLSISDSDPQDGSITGTKVDVRIPLHLG